MWSMYMSCLTFTFVSVMENSSIEETDKKEKKHGTQDPDLTTGECYPRGLEQMFDILTSELYV